MKKSIQTFKEWQKNKSTSVTTLGFIFDDDTIHLCSNTACHAGMKTYGKLEKKPIVALISGMQKGGTDKERLMFANYMLKESIWKDCFLNKNAQDVLDNHWLLSPEMPSNFLTNAAVATRLISEFPAKFQMWKRAYERCKDGDLSYLLSEYYEWGKGDAYLKGYIGNSHNPFYSNNFPSIKDSFIKNKKPVEGSEGEVYQKVRTYDNLCGVWGGRYGDGNYKAVERIRPAVQKDYVNLNIFYKEPVGDQVRWKEDQLDDLVNQFKEIAYA